MMSELKTLLRQARETKGLSLQEAAGMLGTTKGHLHDLESGRSDNPTLRLIAALVIVYGVRPEAMVACALSAPPSNAM
jgi:transcriptional regulator with XRE-family HTH domain